MTSYHYDKQRYQQTPCLGKEFCTSWSQRTFQVYEQRKRSRLVDDVPTHDYPKEHPHDTMVGMDMLQNIGSIGRVPVMN